MPLEEFESQTLTFIVGGFLDEMSFSKRAGEKLTTPVLAPFLAHRSSGITSTEVEVCRQDQAASKHALYAEAWEVTEKQAGQIKVEKGVVGGVALEMEDGLARQKRCLRCDMLDCLAWYQSTAFCGKFWSYKLPCPPPPKKNIKTMVRRPCHFWKCLALVTRTVFTSGSVYQKEPWIWTLVSYSRACQTPCVIVSLIFLL